MSTNKNVLVCNRIDVPHYAPGYQANCDECDYPIWISYSSTEMVMISRKKICMECFLKDAPKDFEVTPPEGESLEEIMRLTGLNKEQALDMCMKTVEEVKKYREKQ